MWEYMTDKNVHKHNYTVKKQKMENSVPNAVIALRISHFIGRAVIFEAKIDQNLFILEMQWVKIDSIIC